MDSKTCLFSNGVKSFHPKYMFLVESFVQLLTGLYLFMCLGGHHKWAMMPGFVCLEAFPIWCLYVRLPHQFADFRHSVF